MFTTVASVMPTCNSGSRARTALRVTGRVDEERGHIAPEPVKGAVVESRSTWEPVGFGERVATSCRAIVAYDVEVIGLHERDHLAPYLRAAGHDTVVV